MGIRLPGEHPDPIPRRRRYPLTVADREYLYRDSAVNWPKWQDDALAGHDGFAFTAPVGSFAPNAWCLYDMHGNAWEWVADWYGEDYYARSRWVDPRGTASGDVRVRRGGSRHTWAFYPRASFRNWNTPQTRYTLVGMRLVLEPEGATPPPSADSRLFLR